MNQVGIGMVICQICALSGWIVLFQFSFLATILTQLPMRNLLLTLVLAMAGLSTLLAQNNPAPLTVMGRISQDGLGTSVVVGSEVILRYEHASGAVHHDTTLTDSDGIYHFLHLPPSNMGGTVILTFTDCQGFSVLDTLDHDFDYPLLRRDWKACPTNSCQAAFVAHVSGFNSIDFENLSTGNPGLTYKWIYSINGASPDSTTDQNLFFMFFGSQQMDVTLVVSDMVGNCSDTTSLKIQNPGFVFCFVDFFWGTNIPYVTFDNGAMGDYGDEDFTWLMGDSVIGTGEDLSQVLFNPPGTYPVTLVLLDTFCSDTFTTWVSNCRRPFFRSNRNGLNVYFRAESDSIGCANITYSWDFGDGNTSTEAYPLHTYATSDTYQVCLTISDQTASFTDSWCWDVIVEESSDLNISGRVNIGDEQFYLGFLYSGFVYLIEYDSVGGTLTALETTNFDFFGSGFFKFENLAPGDYLIKAALNPGTNFYAEYLPTYYGDTLFWDDATPITVNASGVHGLDINLIPGNNPGGPGFIGGLVSQGANKNGDPLGDVDLVLLDVNDQPSAAARSNSNGEFSFDNLAYGTYKLYAEVPGRTATPRIIVLSPDSASAIDQDFEVNSTTTDPVNVDQLLTLQNWQVFPNPTSHQLTITFEPLAPQPATLRLRNTLGQLLQTQPLGTVSGPQKHQMELDGLPAGIYLLELEIGDARQSLRVVKE